MRSFLGFSFLLLSVSMGCSARVEGLPSADAGNTADTPAINDSGNAQGDGSVLADASQPPRDSGTIPSADAGPQDFQTLCVAFCERGVAAGCPIAEEDTTCTQACAMFDSLGVCRSEFQAAMACALREQGWMCDAQGELDIAACRTQISAVTACFESHTGTEGGGEGGSGTP